MTIKNRRLVLVFIDNAIGALAPQRDDKNVYLL